LPLEAPAAEPFQEEKIDDDDEWMDWETRKEHIPIGKHIIAGKSTLSPADFTNLCVSQGLVPESLSMSACFQWTR